MPGLAAEAYREFGETMCGEYPGRIQLGAVAVLCPYVAFTLF